jgi:hypothetical protein
VLLLVLFAVGLAVSLPVALLLRSVRARFILAGVGVVVFAAYSVYVEKIASCPAQGECDKGLGVLFLAFLLGGWLVGVALSWVVRRPSRR